MYFSVAAVTEPESPPKAKAELEEAPAPANTVLAVFKFPPVEKAPIGAPAPVHSSEIAYTLSADSLTPPKANPDVLSAPAPAKLFLP